MFKILFVILVSGSVNAAAHELKIHADFSVTQCQPNTCHGTSDPFRVLTMTLKEVPQPPSPEPIHMPTYSGTWSDEKTVDGIKFFARIDATVRIWEGGENLDLKVSTGPVLNSEEPSYMIVRAPSVPQLNSLSLAGQSVSVNNSTYRSGITVGPPQTLK